MSGCPLNMTSASASFVVDVAVGFQEGGGGGAEGIFTESPFAESAFTPTSA
jgi:hypothetical protein